VEANTILRRALYQAQANRDEATIKLAAAETRSGNCHWSYDVTTEHYDTSCDKAWCFMDGCIEDNGVKFCPFCGGTIIEEFEVNK
jgi:hypothetical protein